MLATGRHGICLVRRWRKWLEPRYDELFTLIQSELRRSGFEDLVAAGIVLTGGTAKMEGVVELAEEIFHMPVRLARPHGVSGLSDVINNPVYSTSVGLLLHAVKQQENKALRQQGENDEKSTLFRIKDWIKGNF